eukprot:scaffold100077_cov69-Phaeocystis_antarctica.AAC.1
MGDCDTDADCKSGLYCFQRGGSETVPGCRGAGVSGYDYCAELPELTLGVYGANGCGAGKCDVCMGDCDTDADCKFGLSCFQRGGSETVPGCLGARAIGYDYCYAPELTKGVDGAGGCGAGKCDVCMGDCDTDADCKSGLSCFQRNGIETVPGCQRGGGFSWDYCYAPSTSRRLSERADPASQAVASV